MGASKKDVVYQVFNKTFDKALKIGKDEEKTRILNAINELIQYHDDTGIHHNKNVINVLVKLKGFINSKSKFI